MRGRLIVYTHIRAYITYYWEWLFFCFLFNIMYKSFKFSSRLQRCCLVLCYTRIGIFVCNIMYTYLRMYIIIFVRVTSIRFSRVSKKKKLKKVQMHNFTCMWPLKFFNKQNLGWLFFCFSIHILLLHTTHAHACCC